MDQPAVISTSSPPTRKAKVFRSKKQWQALLAEFNTSDLSQDAYCKKRRISLSSFHKWRKYFSSQSTESAFADITAQVTEAVPLSTEHPNNAPWQVELELGHGIILRLRTA